MLMVSIYLDDIRTGPPGFTYYCKTAEEVLEIIKNDQIDFISFDHDLGYGMSGGQLADKIERLVYEGKIKCPDWVVHSSNPVGRENIDRAMVSATLICNRRKNV